MTFDPSFSSFTWTDDFFDVLVDRANEGRGLDYLTIIGSTGINAHDVRLLREVVADLYWDEYENLNDYRYHNDSFDDDVAIDDDDDDNYDSYDTRQP